MLIAESTSLLDLSDPLLSTAAAIFIAGIATSLVSLVQARLIRDRRRTRPEQTLADRSRDLSKNLAAAAKAIDALQAEIHARSELVDRLEADATRYEELINTNRAEVEAIAQVLRGELRSEGRRDLRINIAINAISVLAGFGLGVAFG